MPKPSIDHHPSINNFSSSSSSAKPLSANYPPTTIASSASVFSRMPLEDVLEDLASRFILNLPLVELSHIERVCFQVEQAHWFYEDFVRPNSLLNLPSYHLKTFTGLFFDKCEFLTASGAPLAGWDPETAYDKFLRYKERVPVCGAIMLNEDATQVLLVRGFKANSSWSFPRGKINENEQPRDCAIREVLEETGFDIEPYLSLRSNWGDDSRLSAIRKARPSNPTPSGHQNHGGLGRSHKNCTLRSEGDDHFIEITIREQRLRMYLVAGIPNDTVFQTQTRQEIGRIAWFPLTDLPTFTNTDGVSGKRPISKMINVSTSSVVESNGQRATSKFYMVVPFVNDMRTWLTNNSFLTPVGHPLSTPRVQEYQRAYVQTPPHLTKHHVDHLNNGNGMAYESHGNGFVGEAYAVYERTSRLQTFQFCHQDALSSTPPSTAQDGRMMTSGRKKKKKKNTRRKPAGKKLSGPNEPWSGDQNVNVYLSDQLLSTSEEEEEGVEKAVGDENSPWNNLHEGTRALQNFFFGGQKTTSGATADEDDGEAGEDPSVVLGDEPAFGGSSSLADQDAHEAASRLKMALFNSASEPDHRQAIPSDYVPYQGTNPGALHKEVQRELEAQIELEYEKGEPLSEADTDVVKGYDIATSYASSLSSSYRGPSTQIPSSDERNSSTHPPQSTGSFNLLSELLTRHPVNAAEAMYSKHGHLAAPRPQPAPQQVERLLAMLQAPTPGPMSEHGAADESAGLLEQLMLGVPASSPAEAALSTPTGRVVLRPAGSARSEREATRVNVLQQGTTQDPARLVPPHATVLASSTCEPVTPRASDLLELLMKGTSSQSYQMQQGHESEVSGKGEGGGTRIGMNEEERREKKEGLLRQLQELAIGGFQRAGGGGGLNGNGSGGGVDVSPGGRAIGVEAGQEGMRGHGDHHHHHHHQHVAAAPTAHHHRHSHAHHHHAHHHPIIID